jgi:hypothetical protein
VECESLLSPCFVGTEQCSAPTLLKAVASYRTLKNTGNLIVKVEPFDFSLSTVIVPLCSLMMF